MATEDGRKLFVAGLADSITEDVLRQLFEAAGSSVVDVSIPRDRATGRPRGFGFVTLSTEEEAQNVRGALDGSMQAGRSISVRPFQSEPPKRGEARGGGGGGDRGEDRTLYVGNLPYDATQQEIEQLFEGAGSGPLVRIHLPQGQDGRPRGFAFVTLGSSSAAQAAAGALKDSEMRGRRLVVNVAHPKGERPARGPGGGPGGPRRDGPREARPPRDMDGGGGGGGGWGGPPPAEPRRTFDERRKEGKRKRKKGGGRNTGKERDDWARGRRDHRNWDDD